MRIGLITPGFSASEADWCVPALLDLVRVLAERDDVTVFALRYPHHRDSYSVHGATVHASGGAGRGGLGRVPILMRTLARVVRQGRKQPFDVLHALWAHEPGFLAVLAGKRLGTPVVVSLLGGELEDLPEIDYGGERSRANRWLVARALAGADRVTVGSQALARRAADRVEAARLRVCPLGFEPMRFNSGVTSTSISLTGDPVLLHVASLIPVKDQRTLLAAFARVAECYAGARLHIVGEGEAEPTIRAEAARLGLDERIVLHGAVDHGELVAFYQQADLLVQSSRFESQGMAVLEAVACGCPVIGTAVGVVPELCPPELTALPGDVESLAKAMTSALEDSPSRHRLAEHQAQAARDYELRPTVERWRDLFREIDFLNL